MKKSIRYERTLKRIIALFLTAVIITTFEFIHISIDVDADEPPVVDVSVTLDNSGLTYTGAPQALSPTVTVNVNGVEGGNYKTYLALDGGEFAEITPTVTEAGSYTLNWKVVVTTTYRHTVTSIDPETNEETTTEVETLDIEKTGSIPVTVTAPAKKQLVLEWSNLNVKYNGSAQKPTATVYYADDPEKKSIDGGVVGVKLNDSDDEQVDAGTYTAKAELSDALKAECDEPANLTTVFSILPLSVTITSPSGSKAYDNKPFVLSTGVDIQLDSDPSVAALSDDIKNPIASVTCTGTGTQTFPGQYQNSFTYALKDGYTASNYAITPQYGVLNIVAVNALYTVRITAKSGTYTYNGKEQTLDGLSSISVGGVTTSNPTSNTFTAGGKTYTISNFTAKVSGTNVGSYENKISGSPVIKDSSGKDVTSVFNIVTTNGKLTISPKNISSDAVISLGPTLTANGSQQTQTVMSVTSGGMTVTYSVSGNTGTNAGGYTLTVTGTGNFTGSASKAWSIAQGSSSSSGSSSKRSSSSSSRSSSSSSQPPTEEAAAEENVDISEPLNATEVLRYVKIIKDEDVNVRFADNLQAAEAILSDEAKAYVKSRKPVYIRITAKAAEKEPSEDDKTAVSAAIEDNEKEVPGLMEAMYIDIVIETSLNGSDWQTVTELKEPVKVKIDVPQSVVGLSDSYYMLRIHENKSDLLKDLDKDKGTITIETELFSTYVLMYQDPELIASDADEADEAPLKSSSSDRKYWIILFVYLTEISGLCIAILVLQIKERAMIESIRASHRTGAATA